MSPEKKIKAAVQTVITSLMNRVMDKVLVTDPFLPEKHKADKPLYAALVPDEIFKGAHFERRFVTPFGAVWESLAEAVASAALGMAIRGQAIDGLVKEGRLQRIAEVLNRLEHGPVDGERVRPDWDTELKYILEGEGEKIPVRVICDLYAEDVKNKKRYAFEIKAPLPNSDQTKVSKEKILKLYAMEPRLVDEAYFALPYNPYGKRELYAWSFPARWFNMKKDAAVLIGNEFWDKLGGPGTYKSFISTVNEIGKEYKDRIYREFLGIEPPKLEEVL
ncbi:MAG: TdeIII family type II restriction endonuclease [Gallionellaceae bacterium]